jgi:translation initiation factor 1
MSADDHRPFHNPFAVLGPLRGDGPIEAEPARPPQSDTAADAKKISRAVVRLERSGRGGKEVTVIEHLNLNPETRERWLKELKSALGCGGSLEGDAIALQGDQRKRLPKLLTGRGVRKVTVAP